MSYAAGCGCEPVNYAPGGTGLWSSAALILVLYVLLVIILRTFF